MAENLRDAALAYHRYPTPGKIAVHPIKPLVNQYDLSLAYSPGVAVACEVITEDPNEAATVTSRANLVGVITNGTAVLGLGDIGPLASKPVMEGKGVLFRKFAGVNVFDIEVEEKDPKKFCDIVAALEPTFGGINLEDIKAPECFEIEKSLRERMNIPVFHDDQHGTAIIVAAAVLNGLRLVKKDIKDIKLVVSGAGAAALSCLHLLEMQGLPRENIWVTDIEGVVYQGRTSLMDERKAQYAQATEHRTLEDIMPDADIFLGLSAPRVLKPEYCEKMARDPLIFALANPTPEILPEEAKKVRPDAILATGRSDYPNQVNNVLCFPYIFRGALDVGATDINDEMKLACVKTLADMAHIEASDVVTEAYGGQAPTFGPEYLIPKPFDPRLIVELPPAVAKAAMETGVATRPIDIDKYREKMAQFVFRSNLVMKPVFERARNIQRRLAYAEGENERVLQAVQTVVDENLARPILIGRRDVVLSRIERLGLRLVIDQDFELVDPEGDRRFSEYWRTYHERMARKGVTPESAKVIVRTRATVIAALMVHLGDADALICGTIGGFDRHYRHIIDVIGLRDDVTGAATMSGLILPKGTFFITDPYVRQNPTPEEIAEQTIMAADEIQRFGLTPKIALLSHSNFGSRDGACAEKMREAMRLLDQSVPHLEIEGEMQGDAAVYEDIRKAMFPDSRLKGQANLFVMPSIEAANISFNLLKSLGDGLSIGPILLGTAKSAHVLQPSSTVRSIVNMSALAAVDVPEEKA